MFLQIRHVCEFLETKRLTSSELLSARIAQMSFEWKGAFINLKKTREMFLVGASGFEPEASCAQDKSASSRKPLPHSSYSENKALRFQSGMCAAVAGCARLIVGSLQKSLQCLGPSRLTFCTSKPPDVEKHDPAWKAGWNRSSAGIRLPYRVPGAGNRPKAEGVSKRGEACAQLRCQA